MKASLALSLFLFHQPIELGFFCGSGIVGRVPVYQTETDAKAIIGMGNAWLYLFFLFSEFLFG